MGWILTRLRNRLEIVKFTADGSLPLLRRTAMYAVMTHWRTKAEHRMTNDNTHTADEITAAADGLLSWAKEHSGVLAVAATLGEDRDGPVRAGLGGLPGS